MDHNEKQARTRNEFNAVLPQIFNREGLVKKDPDHNRPAPREFNKVMARITSIRGEILGGTGRQLVIAARGVSFVLSPEWSHKFCIIRDNDDQPDVIAALLLNGWQIAVEGDGE